MTKVPLAVVARLEALDDFTQEAFLTEFKTRRKSQRVTYCLYLFFGLHYIYLGKLGLFILYFFSWGILHLDID